MWNRVNPNFDVDAILPYRMRLIVCYTLEGKAGIGEAYVHDGVWYWWSNQVKIQDQYTLIGWTLFPEELLK